MAITDLHDLQRDIAYAIEQACSLDELEQVRVSMFGKKSLLSQQARSLGQLSADERKEAGMALNVIKAELEALFDVKKKHVQAAHLQEIIAKEALDVTLPARPYGHGKIHPISQVMDELVVIFGSMGFMVEDGPEIEEDWYNFTALNMPPSHPARQMQDTFYVDAMDSDGHTKVLRTHTSPVQIRATVKNGAPLRIIAPGRTYRSDSDVTHTPMFHQIEGLVIERNIHFGHLKGCLYDAVSAFFELDDVPLRFRPSYFPFTEPSAEVDIACTRKDGNLKVGEGDSWLEILGSGMVHPNVLANAGLNPDEWQGFAFGIGIERMAMLKYGMPDLRAFFDSNLDWLNHYGFKPWHQPSLLRGLTG